MYCFNVCSILVFLKLIFKRAKFFTFSLSGEGNEGLCIVDREDQITISSSLDTLKFKLTVVIMILITILYYKAYFLPV